MLWRDDEEITDQPGNDWAVQIGQIGGTLTPVKADDAVFTPDGQVLAVAFDGTGATLRHGAPGAEPSWRTHIDDIVSGRLSIAPDARRWTIVGWTRGTGPIEATGTIGGGPADVIRWSGSPGVRYTSIAAAGPVAAALEQHYRRSSIAVALARWGLRLPYESRTQVWRLDPHGRTLVADSELQMACTGGIATDAFICAAFDGTRTRLSTVAIESGRILPIAIVAGRLTPFASHPARGWLTGWNGGTAMAIRLDTMTAYELPAVRGRYARSMTGVGDRLGVIESTGDRTTVSVYALSDNSRAAR